MTPDKTPERSLHRKLAQVMYEAERIPKNGTAPREMGGYKFVQVGDAADYIRKALAEHNITMLPSHVTVVGQQDRPTKSGGNMTTVDLLIEWTLTDADSGETATIMSFGAGADGGDKYSGKASTSAMKYALLSGFMLSTGDDTEGHRTPEQGAPQRTGGFVSDAAHPLPERRPAVPGALTDNSRSMSSYDGLIGTIELAKDSPEFLPHIGPDGPVLTFKLVSPAGGIKVIATGPLAEVLATVRDETIGVRTTCWGRIRDETFTPKGARKPTTYQVLDLVRIKTPSYELPVKDGDSPFFIDADLDPDIEAAADLAFGNEAETTPLGLVS